MTKTYALPSSKFLKVEELPPVSATALKNSPADVLDRVAEVGAIAITRHDKPRAVLLSLDQYREMGGTGVDWLSDLKAEYRGLLDKMQEPAEKAAAEKAFLASPEELGRAALEAATKNREKTLR
jgi:antitoxin Phd